MPTSINHLLRRVENSQHLLFSKPLSLDRDFLALPRHLVFGFWSPRLTCQDQYSWDWDRDQGPRQRCEGLLATLSSPFVLDNSTKHPQTHPLLHLPIRTSSSLDSHSSRMFQTCNFYAPQILWLLPTRLDAIVHNIPPAPRGQVAHRHHRIVSSGLGLSFPEFRRSLNPLSKASVAIAHSLRTFRTSCDSSSKRKVLN